MRQRGLWKVRMNEGNVFIVRAAREASARRYAYETYGTDKSPYWITKATQEDLDEYECWGGRIHDACAESEGG